MDSWKSTLGAVLLPDFIYSFKNDGSLKSYEEELLYI